MSSEVKKFYAPGLDCLWRDPEGAPRTLIPLVLASDYAALEAENARLNDLISAARRVTGAVIEERDAALAQLAAIQGGMGEDVEVVAWRHFGDASRLLCDLGKQRSVPGDYAAEFNIPLMTVAQHQRITAAMAAEVAELKECLASAERQASQVIQENHRLRAELAITLRVIDRIGQLCTTPHESKERFIRRVQSVIEWEAQAISADASP